ncbi:MAG: periplasmic heavy metal sensor [Myxococcales bacterium]|nr:MAG: periplasmic heavy metal sensor [Myxococcales bacterium]
MNLKRILITSFFLGSAAVLVNPALAQPGPGRGRSGMNRQEFRAQRHAKMVEMRAKLLRDKVGLTEAKAKKAEAVFAKYDKQHQDNRGKIRDAHQRLAKLVASNSTSDAEYTKLIKELGAAHDAMHSIRKAQFAALATVLSPKEEAKLLLEMGRMKKRFHRGKGGPGWGPGAGQCDGSGPCGRGAPPADK